MPPRDLPDASSDKGLMDLLRREPVLRIAELAARMGVTATAVRQRLTRLMDAGLVEREAHAAGRGRPSHRYRLTEQGRSLSGSNLGDLAMVLWQEVRAIKDAEVRRGLLQRISRRLAETYADRLDGATPRERMESLAAMLSEKDIPFEVTELERDEQQLPVLTALACPYTEIANRDRSICSMEKMLFAELVGHGLVLSQCRLDGEPCCTFELN